MDDLAMQFNEFPDRSHRRPAAAAAGRPTVDNSMLNLPQYLSDYVRVLRQLDLVAIQHVTAAVVDVWLSNRTVFLCGNGGSAANACHIAADLTKLTAPPRGPRLRAVALTESLSAISAIANDVAYEEIFSEQLRSFCQRGDLVIGLSTSGASPNVLRAIEYANSIGAVTVGITGNGGKKLREVAQHTITIESTSVQHVEDATMVTGHVLCLGVQAALKVLQLRASLRPVVGDSIASTPPIAAAS